MADQVHITFEGMDEIADRIDAARLLLRDMRPLWEQLSADFYKGQKRIFQLKGPGKYEDLDPQYKEQKQKTYGFVYPILFRTGRLASSLLERRSRDSVNEIERQSMEIGTTTPYAKFHHQGTDKMPKRSLWFFDEKSRMRQRWLRIANRYFVKAIQGAFDGTSARR